MAQNKMDAFSFADFAGDVKFVGVESRPKYKNKFCNKINTSNKVETNADTTGLEIAFDGLMSDFTTKDKCKCKKKKHKCNCN
jgi:hypothetical protein